VPHARAVSPKGTAISRNDMLEIDLLPLVTCIFLLYFDFIYFIFGERPLAISHFPLPPRESFFPMTPL
jgi:hypothetical protein